MNFYQKDLTFKENIPNLNSYLIILLGFLLPISVAMSIILLGLILMLWLYEGNFFNKYKIIRKNHITYAFIAFFIVQVIGLLWTYDISWGLHIVNKEWRMLVPLILITIVKKEHIKYYIFSFLLAMSISELLSYSIWFKIIPPFKSATIYDPTPFMSHISYNPFLAFSIFILCYLLIFQKNYSNIVGKLFSIIFVITMSTNMFVTGGRAGQVGFFVMFILLIFLYFKKNIVKAFLITVILIPIVFITAYNTSKIFHNRIDLIKTNINVLNKNQNTSVGLRLTFLSNSLKIIRKYPFFGVGTGDFPTEYAKISKKNTPNATLTVQPHNMYILELVQTGIFGLLAMLSIFYIQIKLSFRDSELSQLRLALPVLFLVVMLSDSYLLGHYTSLLFVYFSSFLYRDFDSENI